jgi:hypothetical protein
MEGTYSHAYTVKAREGGVMLGTIDGGDLPAIEPLESLEAAASKILEKELGIEVDRELVAQFTRDVLAPRLPEAHVDSDQLWEWIDT